MSFILDALKKADAERNLGHLPGIHTRQTVEAAPPAMPNLWSDRKKFLALACSVAIVVVSIGMWQLGKERQASVAAGGMPGGVAVGMLPAGDAVGASSRAASSMPTAPATAPSGQEVAATPTPVTDLPVPRPLTPTSPAPKSPAPKLLALKPLERKPLEPLPPKAPVAPHDAPPAASAVTDATPMTRKGLPAPEHANVQTLVELPPAIQREVPPFAISGSMYSANPADRMLLVDKRMLHEGDEVAPGLVLDSVLPKGAILRYKGHVFRVSN